MSASFQTGVMFSRVPCRSSSTAMPTARPKLGVRSLNLLVLFVLLSDLLPLLSSHLFLIAFSLAPSQKGSAAVYSLRYREAAAIGRYVPGSPAGNVQQHRRPSGLDFCGSPVAKEAHRKHKTPKSARKSKKPSH